MKSNSPPVIFIFIALECEAKPIVSFFDLKKQSMIRPFTVYKNKNTVLTVTGVGKVAMAGAVAYTLAIFSKTKAPILINIGIAGHKTHAIGAFFIAEKIIDNDSGKKFYPQMIINNGMASWKIKTTSLPCEKYNTDYLIDMEASAFYETAVRFTSSELIHCLKVVSDNESSSIDKIQAKIVGLWIDKQVIEIDKVLKYLIELRKAAVPLELMENQVLEKKWHFTVSGKIRLKALLMRWKVLSGKEWTFNNEQNFGNGKEVLQKLEADINSLEVHL